MDEHDCDEHTLLALFRQLLRIRLVEETIAERYAAQDMRCPVHLSVGQEAAAVGVCSLLEKLDQVVSTHRCHGHYLAKGGSLEGMLAELHGRASGCCGGRGGSMHLFDDAAGVLASVPIVGSNVPLAVGAALAFKQRGQPNVAVAFFGDGAVEEGVVHESASFAARHRLPVLFVLENNLYSVYTPLAERQPARPLEDVALAHGLGATRADGNDVLATRRAALPLVRAARAGEGPGWLVLDTYRWREHCGPHYDDELGYRPEGELAAWQARCPIKRLGALLDERGLLPAEERERMFAALQREVDDAFERAVAADFPPSRTAGEGVYA